MRICRILILLGVLLSMEAASLSQTVVADASAPAPVPIVITLQDAISRAKTNSPEFHAALTEEGIAQQDKVLARSLLLPSVNYNQQFIYTQPVLDNAPRFIANNGVHEYLAQGNAHQELNVADLALYRRSIALAELSRAKAQIAARGLLVTVVQNYYGFVVAQRKYSTAQMASAEAARFFDISQKLERGGEVAHADTIKAHLQLNDKERDFREAVLGLERARVSLALLIFPDFNQNFSVVDDLRLPDGLPSYEEVERLAKQSNPDLAVALSAVKAGNFEVQSAKAGYFPVVAFDYNYGIDASHFATKTDGVRNLGYSAVATLSLPIWNWGATHSKVKQSILRRDQAKLELTFAQRRLLGQLKLLYQEAQTSNEELDLLRQSAQLASESLRLTTLRYQGGEATVLEVVDAQNAFALARNTFDDGEVRYRTALANLQTLTGTF
ncbi:MAG: outer rane efflux protein [Candidatus Angelobacter sp.]|nr:outer rane efflux protein [Candidatus Angelobacter sp.]